MRIDPKTALLQVLISADGFGLELIDRVKEATNGALKLGPGTIYPALRDLERDGLIESYRADPLPERRGRPRIYYSITAEGRRAFHENREKVVGFFGRLAPARA